MTRLLLWCFCNWQPMGYQQGLQNQLLNTILRCPLWELCKCPCEAKIVTSSTTTILFVSNPHTKQHHSKDKDKYVHLSYEEKTFVKKAVKFLPMQSTGDLLCSVQDTDYAIDFSLKKSPHPQVACLHSCESAQSPPHGVVGLCVYWL